MLLEALNKFGNFNAVSQEFNEEQLGVIYELMDMVDQQYKVSGVDATSVPVLPLQNVSVSLRDFFAAEAMKAECISWNAELSNEYRAKILEDMIERWGQTTVYEAIALNSWEMADNMLKAKSRYER